MQDLIGHMVDVIFLDEQKGYPDHPARASGTLLAANPSALKVAYGRDPLWYPMLRVASVEHNGPSNDCQCRDSEGILLSEGTNRSPDDQG